MTKSSSLVLDSFQIAFTAARSVNSTARLDDFLPPRDHPRYLGTLSRLVQIDLDFGWRQGRPRALSSYLLEYPELSSDADIRHELLLCEENLRKLHEGVRRSESPSGRLGSRIDPNFPPMPGFPSVGTKFLDFELVAELGRGSFGRVYVARQPRMADRLVVLKIAADVDMETQTLAQLVHTHIVPVYSFHSESSLKAACMPWLGATTLAHVFTQIAQRQELPKSGRFLRSTLQVSFSGNAPASGIGWPKTDPVISLPPELPIIAPAATSVLLEQIDRMSWIETVLWLGSCLADALAHAHDRGIIHRDLKPANILLTDEGQPMILDFNLAFDPRRAANRNERIGGTINYMAPEHLEAFQGGKGVVDARSDIYSLGVILYQLLTLQHPHNQPVLAEEDLQTLLEGRNKPPRSVCELNPSATPAVDAILRKCLHQDPEKRYQSARELHEDLERQRNHLPLEHTPEPSLVERGQKWSYRHPRLATAGLISLIAGVMISLLLWGFVWRGQALTQASARQRQADFQQAFSLVQFMLNTRCEDRDWLEQGCTRAAQCLAIWGVLDRGDWRQDPAWLALSPTQRLQQEENIGEVLFLLARGKDRLADTLAGEAKKREQTIVTELLARARGCFAEDQLPPLILRFEAGLLVRAGLAREASQLMTAAQKLNAHTPRALALDGADFAFRGHYRDAVKALSEAVALQPNHFAAWFAVGYAKDSLLDNAGAIAAYSTAIALEPDFPWTYSNRGLVLLRQGESQLAWNDFDHLVQVLPDELEPRINRALADHRLNRNIAAKSDLTAVLEMKTRYSRVWFMRSRVLAALGDIVGAEQDLQRGLKELPQDEQDRLARAVAFIGQGKLKEALLDLDAVLARNPRSYVARSNKAYLLAEKLDRLQDAIYILDRAVDMYPDAVALRSGRAVYHARLGHNKEATLDIGDVLKREKNADLLYQSACVYALLSKDQRHLRQQALGYLAAALDAGYRKVEQARTDPDLELLRDDPGFEKLLEAVKLLERK
jgi:serine/threonine protein kinase/predicted Zn-dependent protease